MDASCSQHTSELLGLTWEALDLDAGVLRITAGRVYGFGSVFDGGPKSANSRRLVNLPAAVVLSLRAWRAKQAQERLVLEQEWAAGGLVFTTSTGRPVNPRNLSRSLKRLCKASGAPGIRLYDLRHTFGSMALAHGGDLKTVASVMGHDPTMLQRVYQHIHQDARQAVVDRVAAALEGGDTAPDQGRAGVS